MKQRRYPALQLGGLVVVSVCALLCWAERKSPLRKRVEQPLRRGGRNGAVAGLAAVTVQLAEMPVVRPVAQLVERRRWGLLGRLRSGSPLRTVASVVLLDYTLYLWHVLTHRVPLLWRFHAVHHVDLDLDASTALRFHFGELTLSVPWRAAQVAAIGVSDRDLRLWQQLVLVSILFHHSNLRLPARLDRLLATVIVTPRLHGIHHADVETLRDANWSSGLTIWDRLHNTYRDDVAQEAITIGVEGYEHPQQVTLPKILAMPFAERSN